MSVDDILRDMRERRLVLTFLQQLRDGSWHAAIRRGQDDFERGTGATAAAALQHAVANADASVIVPFRDIWLAGRRGAEQPTPAAASLDVFA